MDTALSTINMDEWEELDLLELSQMGQFEVLNNGSFLEEDMFMPPSQDIANSSLPTKTVMNETSGRDMPSVGSKCCTISCPPADNPENVHCDPTDVFTAVPIQNEKEVDIPHSNIQQQDQPCADNSAETMRQPTYVSITEDDKENFLHQMKNKNTVRKTESSLKQFQRWVNLNNSCLIITND